MTVQPLYGLAFVSNEQHAYTQTLEYADAALQINTHSIMAHLLKAYTYMDQQELDKADEEVQAALAPDAGEPYALLARGDIYFAKGKRSEALLDFQRLIEAYPGWATPYARSAQVKAALNDLSAARADAKKAIELDPYLPEGYLTLASIAEMDTQWSQELEYANKAIELSPNDPAGYALRGYAYFQQNNYSKAIADLKRVVAMTPENMPAHFYLFGAYYESGDIENAIAQLDFVASNSDDVDQIAQAERQLDFLKTIPHPVNGKRTLTDPAKNYSLTYPTNWAQDVPPDQNGLEVKLMRYGGATPGQALFYVFDNAEGAKVEDFEKVVNAVLEKQAGYTALDLETSKLGKDIVLTREYRLKQSGQTQHGKQYYVTHGKFAYALLFAVDESLFNKYLPEIDDIFFSLQLTP